MDLKMIGLWLLVAASMTGALAVKESSPISPLQSIKYSATQRESRIPPSILFEKISRNANSDSHLSDVNENSEGYHANEDDIFAETEQFEERPGLLKDLGKDLLPEFVWYPLSYSQQTEDHEIQRRASVASVLNQLAGLYLPNQKLTNETQCLEDLDAIYRLKDALEITMLVDSWGKFPDGFLAGNTYVFGSFDECLKVKFSRNASDPDQGDFRGQYCTVSYTKRKREARNENQETEVRMAPIVDRGVSSFTYGTCIPASCSVEDLRESIDHQLQEMGLNLKISRAACQVEEHPSFEFTPGAIVMIVILAVEGSLILFSGLLDLWISYAKKDELRKGPLKYLLVFSLATNLEKMFRINTSESKDSITSFYGIRVLSMAWVVMGHQYMYRSYSVNKNFVPDLVNGNFAAQIILNSYASVETFFFMSGFLVAYVFFKDQERGGKFNIFLFYFHRFIRLSPPIMLWSGFLATFQSQLARGPMADRATRSMENCRKFWYRDAFFMSNFDGYGEESQGKVSSKVFGVSWYTSVDSQLYLASPVFLLPFILKEFLENKKYKSRFVGILWLAFWTLVSCVIPGIIIGVNHLPPNPVRGAPNTSLHHKLVYYAPWCRASPYLVGMALAYFLRTNKKEILLKPWQVVLGWIVATGLGIAVVFGMYRYNQMTTDLIEYEWAPSIFYGSLHSLVWALAVSWVVFACHYGYGGPVNSFLSHPSFQPLNRVTYCIFLVALSLQGILNANLMIAPYFSNLNKIIEIVGVIFIAGIGGILLSLFTEGPILGLERILLRK
ncbi:nose resistant to fluoxetine protein 6-like [Macrobrachium rosenbergii]|uniref:nose resistant to fluoxetine protein 6-like n=1 Tax=Macrobrachium rosenbergii TaxID=79674 RepID=UPI0034D77D23